ncbi:MAG TPA: ribonuclease Z [Anaerolineales bacterium]|nr:ribonuclease Z [Anaerolineales bacterium]
MFEYIFLGTAASAPSIRRGLTANLVLHNDQRFLIDCGEGTQRQILQSGLGFRRLDKVLITHSHLDHILGLGGLMSTLARWENKQTIEIWAGRAALQRIKDLLFKVVLREHQLDVKIELCEIQPGLLMKSGSFELHAVPVQHRGPDCFGFVFEEKPHRPFLAETAQALGVPFGPERRLLVQGQAITLSDGRVVQPDAVLGDWQAGAKLVHIGDCGDTRNLVDVCQHADALVIEATYNESERAMAKQFGHLTARQAAELAQTAQVKHLYLTHISRRYREKELRDEARAVFSDTFIAHDFDTFTAKRGQSGKPSTLARAELDE